MLHLHPTRKEFDEILVRRDWPNFNQLFDYTLIHGQHVSSRDAVQAINAGFKTLTQLNRSIRQDIYRQRQQFDNTLNEMQSMNCITENVTIADEFYVSREAYNTQFNELISDYQTYMLVINHEMFKALKLSYPQALTLDVNDVNPDLFG